MATRKRTPAQLAAKRIHDAAYRKRHPDYKRNHYVGNRDTYLAKAKAYKLAHPEETAARLKNWKARNPDKLREYFERDRRKRGLPLALRPRPDVCDLCGSPPIGKQGLHLDHCHETGAFRGWLCHRCNLGIGCLGDTAASVREALAYLTRCCPIRTARQRESALIVST